jgi:hypothetical protein
MVNKACRYSRIVRLVRVDDAVGLMLGYDTTYVVGMGLPYYYQGAT